MPLPTDRYVLECIYDAYKDAYPGALNEASRPKNDPYIAIDIDLVAQKIPCSRELLFGRLYYHLNAKYRYKNPDGSVVPLFELQIADKRHAVQFPYLVAILAGLNQDYRRHLIPLCISVVALCVALASLAEGFFKH